MHPTDFEPHAKLLHALEIPFVVVTDGDVRDAFAASPPGVERAARILAALGDDVAANAVRAHVAGAKLDAARAALASKGIFVGGRTLETDLFSSGAGLRMKATFKALFPTVRAATVAPFDVKGALGDTEEDAIIKLAERAGKGRFSQSFAARMAPNDVPAYIRGAIEAIVTKCRRV